MFGYYDMVSLDPIIKDNLQRYWCYVVAFLNTKINLEL